MATTSEGLNYTAIFSAVFAVIVSIWLYRCIFVRKIRRFENHGFVNLGSRRIWKKGSKDVVLVHCPTPGYYTPNISPFVMKLLTYLRLAQIPYKIDNQEPLGKKGKTPWITLNGEEICDSQFIIDTLNQQFKKDFNSNLSEEQRATSRAMAIMIEEHLALGLRVWRFTVDDGRTILNGMRHPFYVHLVKPFFVRRQKTQLWHQGIGRHTPAEVEKAVINDLRSLSSYLGKKPFLMGDKLSEVDCTMFAFMANILYNYNRSPYYKVIRGELKNIYNYVIRVKRELWPDWDKCLEKRKL